MISPQDLANRKHERPFRPFRAVMANGEIFEVWHELDYMAMQDRVVLPTGQRIQGIPERGIYRRYDEIERIEPLERHVHGKR